MRLNSRERVLTAFAHQEPDRVPVWCGASEEFWAKAKAELGLDDEPLRGLFGDDFRRVHAGYRGPDFALQHAGAVYRTVFGVEREGLGYGQPITHPLTGATLDEIHAYPWPSADWVDASAIREIALAWKGEYAILGGDWSPFWHDAIDLFFIGNDFGSQTGPLLGAALFDQFIQPHLRRLAKLGHDYGLGVMMHCCGGVRELIPLFIDAGIDAIHAVQLSCRGMDIAELKRDFGDRLVFNGAIDSHHVLIDGTPETVRQSTREVLEIMKPGGGYICGASHDTILGETPVGNVVAMFDAVREFGNYP